ncbi:MAG: creatininase family protein [Phycisphaerae bacterium]
MQWAHMTAADLIEARRSTNATAALPIGSLEKHGEHLPLGTDSLAVERKVLAAAEIEPVVVLPTLYYSHVKEMKNSVGAIALETDLLMKMVENICDEAARNGFKRIILVNGHGGNRYWLPLLMMNFCDADKDYAAFLLQLRGLEAQINKLRDSDVAEAHAGEIETSVLLHLHPGLVRMERLPVSPGLRRQVPSLPAYTPIEWYSWYPDAYAGDARPATAEKGRKAFDIQVQAMAEAFARIKADQHVLDHIVRFSRDKRSLADDDGP